MEKKDKIINLSEYITLNEYAIQHNIDRSTIIKRIKRGLHPSAIKVGSQWILKKNEDLIDRRYADNK